MIFFSFDDLQDEFNADEHYDDFVATRENLGVQLEAVERDDELLDMILLEAGAGVPEAQDFLESTLMLLDEGDSLADLDQLDDIPF